MIFACHPDSIGMTLTNRTKGGEAYGKVPKRIAITRTLLSLRRALARKQALEMAKGQRGFAEGKRTMPGPGKRTIAFRHCEECSDVAIS